MYNSDIKFEKLLNHKDINALFKTIQAQFCKSHTSLKAIKDLLRDNMRDHYLNCGLYYLDDADIVQITDYWKYGRGGKTENEVDEFTYTIRNALFRFLEQQINKDLGTDIYFYDIDKDFNCSLDTNLPNDKKSEEDYIAVIKEWARDHKWIGILNVDKMLKCWICYEDKENDERAD